MPNSDTHYSVPTSFPPFALGFLDEDTLVLGGGGGSSKSGVKNKVCLARLQDRVLKDISSKEMDADEDAPMSLAVDANSRAIAFGANQAPKFMKRGENNNLRVVHAQGDTLTDGTSCQALDSEDDSIYQRAAALSRDGSLLAVGNTDGTMAVFTFPDLQPTALKHTFVNDELYDLDFNDSGSKLVATTSKTVQIWSVTEKDLISPTPKILQIIDAPGPNFSFRSAKFGRGNTSDRLYTLVNSSAAASKQKGAARKAFLSTWSAHDCTLRRTRVVAKRPITAVDVSPDGRYLALGGSDLTISIWNATSLLPLRMVRAAHDFPATALRFSPSSQTVVSTSADSTLRVVPVAKTWAVDSKLWTALLILLFSLIIAYALKQ